MAEEGLRRTDNDLIHIGSPIPFDADQFLRQLDRLMSAAYSNKKNIRALVAEIVSTYHPAQPAVPEAQASAPQDAVPAAEREFTFSL